MDTKRNIFVWILRRSLDTKGNILGLEYFKIRGPIFSLQKYKAYTLHQDGYNLFVLLTPNTPTFALR